ncbi:unnamed protein product [Symbiodinium sp. CCMP2592]|nr:unnamed protein product [Symbiodinium sp. CCMP2592]
MAVASMMEKADQEIMELRIRAATLIEVTGLKATPKVGSGTTPITRATGKGGAITGTIGMNVANVTEIVVTGFRSASWAWSRWRRQDAENALISRAPSSDLDLAGETRRITEEAMKAGSKLRLGSAAPEEAAATRRVTRVLRKVAREALFTTTQTRERFHWTQWLEICEIVDGVLVEEPQPKAFEIGSEVAEALLRNIPAHGPGKAAGFDSVTKPREAGKVPTEVTSTKTALELSKIARIASLSPRQLRREVSLWRPAARREDVFPFADVHGLKGASQYNGCEGIVIEGPNDKGRWEVQAPFADVTCWALFLLYLRMDTFDSVQVDYQCAAKGPIPATDEEINASLSCFSALFEVSHCRPFPLPSSDPGSLGLAPSGPSGHFGAEARKHFCLEDGFTFLNHGAFGATLKSSLESKRRWAEHIETQPVRFLDRELFPSMVSVTRSLSQVLSVPAEDLLPVPSATLGTNAVLRSWQRQRKPDDSQRAVILSVAYGSTKKLLKRMSEESGFQVVEATVDFPLAGDAEERILASLEGSLQPNTSLVILDAIPSNAPFVLPLREAVALCRAKAPEAFVMVDAAHGLFSLPLKLTGPSAVPVDALVTNCHKWFCGPKGTAVLYVAPEHQKWVDPLVISHGYGSDFPSGFYWPGLSDFTSWLALDEVLAFWDLVGLEPARIYGNYLVMDAATMLAESWDTSLGIPEDLLGPMALVALPTFKALQDRRQEYTYDDAEAVQNALFQRRIEVPVKVLSGNLYARISAHIYNHIEEYETLRDAVLELQHLAWESATCEDDGSSGLGLDFLQCWPVVDADKIAHELLADTSGTIHKRVVSEFGTTVLDSEGVIDREKLGKVIFSDPAKRRKLDKATHGPILTTIVKRTLWLMLQGHRTIVLDVPLLLKFPVLRRLCLSAVLVVLVSPETQLTRLMARNDLSEDEARRKIDSQLSGEAQCKLADFVIENNGSFEDLRRSVADLQHQAPQGWSAALGVCLAQMALKESAEAALQNLRRFEIKGTQVSVDWSTMAKTEMGLCNKRHQKPPDEPPPRSFKESTAQEFGFQMGQAVLISNLKGAPQFNGCSAAVVGFRSDRVEVEVEAEGTKKILALKPENLSASTGQAEPPKAEEASAEQVPAEQVPAEKAPEPRRRRGKWEENSGGFVVNQAKKGPVGPKLPPLADLEAMPVKELKQVLVAHDVNITGCLERAEFLAKAKEVAEQRA